jgi:hypothetical protein
MKALKTFVPGIVIVTGLPFLSCSLPENIEPAQWKMHVEIPIIDRNISIDDLLPEGSYNGLTVASRDSTVSGDTIAVIKSDSLKYVFEQQLRTIDTSTIEKKMGSCKLHHLPPVHFVFTLGTALPERCFLNAPIPSPVTLSLSKKGALKGLHSITIDENSPDLEMTFANLSESVDMEDVVIALLDNNDVIGTVHMARLPAGSSKTMSVSLAGKCVQPPIAIAACITIPSGAVVRPEDRFGINFSLNDQILSEAVIGDSLIEYSNEFTGDLVIADSIRIDMIEVDKTFLCCELSSPVLLKMEIAGTFVNASQQDFSDRRNLPSTVQLNTDIDSVGVAVADTLFKSPENVQNIMKLPVHAMRIFPSWNESSGQSYIRCRFKFRSLPDGRLIRFNKNDVFKIRLMQPDFPLVRVNGCFIKGIEQGFTTKMKVGQDWKSSIADSLKRSSYFQSARLHLNFVPGLPQGSSIDSLLLRIVMKDPDKTDDSAVINQKFVNILPDSHYVATVDFTGLFNSWPDTLVFDTRIVLPPGTGLTMCIHDGNNEPASFLKISPSLTWTLTVPLCWKINDTIRIEPGKTSMSLKSDQLDWITKLEQPRIRIILNVLNQTSLSFTLFALGAPGMYEDELMAFPATLVGAGDLENRIGGHLFTLFGKDGLRLVPGDRENSTVVQLDKRGIDALLSRDSCSIRWFLTIPTRDVGALLATDYCSLRATGLIDGIGRTDSLLYME